MGITVQAKPAGMYKSDARTTLRRLPTNRSNLRSADGRFLERLHMLDCRPIIIRRTNGDPFRWGRGAHEY